MNPEGRLISEKLHEITRMCAREHPIYEQIGNFSIALYVLGHFQCSDLLSADDVDDVGAGKILDQDFVRIKKEDVPKDYDIRKSREKYLLVIGDPVFPTHFAVIVNMKDTRPYFSKLRFYGTGFDSLPELKKEFIGHDGIGRDDIYYYKMIQSAPIEKDASKKIYTFRDDGRYAVLDYSYATMKKGERSCL